MSKSSSKFKFSRLRPIDIEKSWFDMRNLKQLFRVYLCSDKMNMGWLSSVGGPDDP